MISAPRFSTNMLRAAIAVLGVALLVWGAVDFQFRDNMGEFTKVVCIPVALGVSLIVQASVFAGPFRQAGFWFALALFGQAASLQFIEAGTSIRYQHYRIPENLLTDEKLYLLLFLLVQLVLVIMGLKRWWPSVRMQFGRINVSRWRVAGVAALFVISSATLSREPLNYFGEVCWATLIQSVSLANLALVVLSLPESGASLTNRFSEWLRPSMRQDRLALLGAVWVTVFSALLCWLVYEKHPHVPDEVGYLIHARYFAAGQLTMPAPPVPEAFNLDLIQYDEHRSFSPVPPGWPAVLAVGFLIGVPWLINPLLGGLGVWLTYVVLRDLYDRRVALLVVCLMCVSPWHIFLAMSFMTHSVTLVCAMAATWFVMQARKTQRAIWTWPAGFAIGAASLVRPLEGFILAILLGLWSIGLGGKRLKISAVAGLVLSTILTGALVFPYNQYLAGSPTKFPIQAYVDNLYGPGANDLGFGANRGLGWALDAFPGHSPLEAVINSLLNLSLVNSELLGWSVGSLLFLAIFIFTGKLQTVDYLMVAVIVAIVGVHGLYWFGGGPDFGARYWYLILVPCLVLTARGILHMADGAKATSGWRVLVAAGALCVLTLVTYFPWRSLDKYHHYRSMRSDVRELAQQRNFGRSLVLVRGNRHPDYASAAIYNPLDLRSDNPIYAWDKSPDVRARLLEEYRDRPVWVLNGPTLTGRGYEVVSGPSPAADIAALGNHDGD